MTGVDRHCLFCDGSFRKLWIVGVLFRSGVSSVGVDHHWSFLVLVVVMGGGGPVESPTSLRSQGAGRRT